MKLKTLSVLLLALGVVAALAACSARTEPTVWYDNHQSSVDTPPPHPPEPAPSE